MLNVVETHFLWVSTPPYQALVVHTHGPEQPHPLLVGIVDIGEPARHAHPVLGTFFDQVHPSEPVVELGRGVVLCRHEVRYPDHVAQSRVLGRTGPYIPLERDRFDDVVAHAPLRNEISPYHRVGGPDVAGLGFVGRGATRHLQGDGQ